MIRGRTAAILTILLAAEAFATAPPAVLRDRQGDPLPAGAIARLGSLRLRDQILLLGHLALSPDGSKIAHIGQVIHVWDRASGRLLREFDPDILFAWSLAFTPDGKGVLAGYTTPPHTYRLDLWNLDTGDLRPSWEIPATRGMPHWLRFSRDGRTLAVVHDTFPNNDEPNAVRIYDFAARKERAAVPSIYGSWSGTMLLSPDGSQVIAGGKGLAIWDIAKKKEVRTIDLAGFPRRMALSRDGKVCAVHWDKGPITFVSLQSPFKTVTSAIKCEEPTTLAFSADGKELYSATPHGQLVALDAVSGRQKRILVAAGKSWRHFHAFSADGRYFASSDQKSIEVVDTATGALASPRFDDHRDGTGIEAVPSPDGLRVVTRSDSELRIWDMRSGRMLRRIGGTGFVPGVRWSEDGKTVAAACPGRIGWYDASNGKLVREAKLPVGKLTRAGLLLPGGKEVSWTIENPKEGRLLGITDVGTGKDRFRVAGREKGAESVQVSEDANRLLRVKYLDGGRLLEVEEIGGRVIWKQKLSEDYAEIKWLSGRFVVVSSPKGVETWDVQTGHVVGPRVMKEYAFDGVLPFALSPDGRMAVFGWGHVKRYNGKTWSNTVPRGQSRLVLVELATGQVRSHFPLIGSVLNATFTADGRFLVTGSGDGTGLVWDVRGLTACVRPGQPWDDLGSANGRIGFAAVTRLVASPRQALALLKANLTAATVNVKQMRSWMDDLDAESFERRDEVEGKLALLGEDVEEDLRSALKKDPPLEVQVRLRRLLDRIEMGSPRSWRRARAVEVLEQVGSPEAKALLKTLAAGYTGSRLTRLARESLDRLKRLR